MKKRLSIGGVASALLVGSLCFWLGLGEYGEGNAERVRKYWNDSRQPYPEWCLLSGVTDSANTYNTHAGLSEDEFNQLIERQRCLDSELERLVRKDELIPWKVGETPDLNRLPLEGMSRAEIRQLAAQNNADACLMMAKSFLEYKKDGAVELTWGEYHEVEYWLKRAIDLKRRGALFLLHYLRELRQSAVDYVIWDSLWPGHHPLPSLINGYGDFDGAIQSGDAMAYMVLQDMCVKTDSPALGEYVIEELKKKADAGDTHAAGQLVKLLFDTWIRFEPRFGYISSLSLDSWIIQEMKESLSWLKVLPELDFMPIRTNQKIYEQFFFRYGMVSEESSETWKTCRICSDYAYRAACQGNLSAMFVWLRFGMSCVKHFSREEWENMIIFHRTLSEAGYLPYWKHCEVDWKFEISTCFENEILRSWFSRESMDQLRDLYGKAILKRDEAYQLREQIKTSGMDDVRDICARLNDMCREGMDAEAMAYCRHVMELASPPVRDAMAAWGEKCYRQGNLTMTYAFAGIYEQGIGVPVDLGKAWRNLMSLVAPSVPYCLWMMKYDDGWPWNDHIKRKLSFPNCVKLDAISMVLRHPEFPGRDESEAYRLAMSMDNPDFHGVPMEGPVCYVLGIVHERGIGTQVDKEKALRYYKACSNGSWPHQGCRERFDALTEQI